MLYSSNNGLSKDAIAKLHAIENELLSWFNKTHDHDDTHSLSSSHTKNNDTTDHFESISIFIGFRLPSSALSRMLMLAET